jgi:hypothetical protein
MKNYLPLVVLAFLGVETFLIASTVPNSVAHTVSIQWIDGKNTTIMVDDISTSEGFLSLHVIDDPVGWMIIPAFSIHWIVAVEIKGSDDTKTIGFDDIGITDLMCP